MAVTKVPQTSRLVIKVQTGLNGAGNPVYRVRSYPNVKPSAADADVLAVAQGLAGLQQYPVVTTGRVDEANLLNQ